MCFLHVFLILLLSMHKANPQEKEIQEISGTIEEIVNKMVSGAVILGKNGSDNSTTPGSDITALFNSLTKSVTQFFVGLFVSERCSIKSAE